MVIGREDLREGRDTLEQVVGSAGLDGAKLGPLAKACVAAFLDTGFAGGRHQRRVDELSHLLQDSD